MTAINSAWSGLQRELAAGDRAFLYTTRGCFRNPTRDQGRLIGDARIGGVGDVLEEPVVFRNRTYETSVTLQIKHLAPWREGVALAPLVSQLSLFPKGRPWGPHLRRPFVRLN